MFYVFSVKTEEDAGGKERVNRNESNNASADLEDSERQNKS